MQRAAGWGGTERRAGLPSISTVPHQALLGRGVRSQSKNKKTRTLGHDTSPPLSAPRRSLCPQMRWAVVTGAGSGIGAALALSLLRAGIGVVAVGRRADKLNELRACVLSEESEAVAQDMLSRLKTVAADVASAAGQQAVAAALPADEPLNFLVNNAGVGVPDKIENVSRQHFEDALAVNVTGPLFLTQLLLPRLRLCGGEGRVLNIGSGIADRVQTGTGTYGVTKKALHRLTLQMAAELADDDRGPEARVWVGYARPGVVDTEVGTVRATVALLSAAR